MLGSSPLIRDSRSGTRKFRCQSCSLKLVVVSTNSAKAGAGFAISWIFFFAVLLNGLDDLFDGFGWEFGEAWEFFFFIVGIEDLFPSFEKFDSVLEPQHEIDGGDGIAFNGDE